MPTPPPANSVVGELDPDDGSKPSVDRPSTGFEDPTETSSISAAEPYVFSDNSSPWEAPLKARTSRITLHSHGSCTSADLSVHSNGDRRRDRLAACIGSLPVQLISGTGIIVTFMLTCSDIDRRASGLPAILWHELTLAVCFGIYVLEFLGIAYIEQSRLFNQGMNRLDLALITSGIADYVLAVFGVQFRGFGIFRVLRFFRLVHLLRTSWGKKYMRELRNFIMMFSSSFKTLFWSCFFCFLVMTFWSAIAVELLHHRVQRLMELEQVPESWSECERCSRAFATVMDANLTFFQTIVAGDSWGLYAIPVIEAHPWSAIIFVGAYMTLVYGVLGLIVAVIVDMFAELRAKDIGNIASDLEKRETDTKKELYTIFREIDRNKDGQVTLQEILAAPKRVPRFRDYLRILRIEDTSLAHFFQVLDTNGNRRVEPTEFVNTMYSLRMSCDTPRATSFSDCSPYNRGSNTSPEPSAFLRNSMLVSGTPGTTSRERSPTDAIEHINSEVFTRLRQIERELQAQGSSDKVSDKVKDDLDPKLDLADQGQSLSSVGGSTAPGSASAKSCMERAGSYSSGRTLCPTSEESTADGPIHLRLPPDDGYRQRPLCPPLPPGAEDMCRSVFQDDIFHKCLSRSVESAGSSEDH